MKEDDDGNIQRPVSMIDIQNVRRNVLYQNTLDLSKSEKSNVLDCLTWKSVRAYNLDAYYPEDVISNQKHVDTNGKLLIMLMSENQRKLFRKHPYTLLLDGTHCTNRSKFILISGLILNSRFEGSPILQAIVESENSESLGKVFEVLKSLEPEAFGKINSVVTDLAPAFEKLILNHFK